MKKCSNCFKLKPTQEFYTRRSGYQQSRCKACNAEVVRGYRERRSIAESSHKGFININLGRITISSNEFQQAKCAGYSLFDIKQIIIQAGLSELAELSDNIQRPI